MGLDMFWVWGESIFQDQDLFQSNMSNCQMSKFEGVPVCSLVTHVKRKWKVCIHVKWEEFTPVKKYYDILVFF